MKKEKDIKKMRLIVIFYCPSLHLPPCFVKEFDYCFFMKFWLFDEKKKFVFGDNFWNIYSNLMYDTPKFKLDFPLNDKKKNESEIITLQLAILRQTCILFLGAPGRFIGYPK